MSLARIAHSLGVGTIAVVLALTAYGARADGAAPTATVHATHHAAHASAHPSAHKVRDAKFVAPVAHKYGANGMRMGLHCETHDPS